MGKVSILELYNSAKATLKSAGTPNYINESAYLIEEVTGVKKFEMPIKGELIATNEQVATLKAFVKRRKQGDRKSVV